jgi:hypothetical protein
MPDVDDICCKHSKPSRLPCQRMALADASHQVCAPCCVYYNVKSMSHLMSHIMLWLMSADLRNSVTEQRIRAWFSSEAAASLIDALEAQGIRCVAGAPLQQQQQDQQVASKTGAAGMQAEAGAGGSGGTAGASGSTAAGTAASRGPHPQLVGKKVGGVGDGIRREYQ